jgi:phage-related baseplate assembly protein
MTTRVDLSSLPPPEIISPLDFETVFAAMKSDVLDLAPELSDVLDLESEPATKLLQVMAYREILLRAHVNDDGRSVMLAYATGSNLENLAALFGVVRLTVVEADPTASPPVVAVLESDVALRYRTQTALERFGAGTEGSYTWHALAVDGRIVDVAAKRGTESGLQVDVVVTYLALDANGAPITTLTAAILAALNDEDVRALSDTIVVQPATVVPFDIEANLLIDVGPDSALIEAEARARLDSYLAGARRIGRNCSKA